MVHLLQAATAVCAEVNTILDYFFTRLCRHRAVSSRNSAHSERRDEEQWLPFTTAPSTSTRCVSTTSAPTITQSTLTTSKKSPSSSTLETICISSISPRPWLNATRPTTNHLCHHGPLSQQPRLDRTRPPPNVTTPHRLPGVRAHADDHHKSSPTVSFATMTTIHLIANVILVSANATCAYSDKAAASDVYTSIHQANDAERERDHAETFLSSGTPAVCSENVKVVNGVTGDLRLFFDQIMALSQRNYESKYPRRRGHSTSSNY
ncbi:hypothetical protein RB195_005994 [Necator americanus]|uniref:Uncharacterized protein n=1 Tax=Necator americanus TaxID=51031 RepID=A0ABR1BUB7_NECAM